MTRAPSSDDADEGGGGGGSNEFTGYPLLYPTRGDKRRIPRKFPPISRESLESAGGGYRRRHFAQGFDFLRALVCKLHAIEARVDAFFRDELVVGALLDDATFV